MRLLHVVMLLLQTLSTSAYDNYIIMLPKTISPGVATDIQYNFRESYGSPNYTVITQIDQNGVPVYKETQILKAGQVMTSTMRVPPNLVNGKAWVYVSVIGAYLRQSSGVVDVMTNELPIFIQTDKPVYKPSQTVNFRVVAVDSKLLPSNGTCDIDIRDAEGNKIKQWKAVELESGVITKKLELSDQPVLGDWKITAKLNKGKTQDQTFAVDKYVLPKFEVSVNAPVFMLADQKQVKVEIDAKYTYGQGVIGTALVSLTDPTSYPTALVQLPDLDVVNGKVTITLKEYQLQNFIRPVPGQSRSLYDPIIILVNVTEALTGISKQGEGRVKVSATSERLEFLPTTPHYFKPRLNYTGFLKLSQIDGSVVSSPKNAILRVAHKIYSKILKYPWVRTVVDRYEYIDVAFTANGLGKFSFMVPNDTDIIDFEATYTTENFWKIHAVKNTVEKMHSLSGEYAHLELLSERLQAGSPANFKLTSTIPTPYVVDYQIRARGSTLETGTVYTDFNSTFSIQMLPSMAPSCTIVIYFINTYTTHGDMIADSLELSVDGAFDRNQVTVKYSNDQPQPGESVVVEVAAVTGSLVGLVAVDQSVLLLAGGNDITQSDVLSKLKLFDQAYTTDISNSGRYSVDKVLLRSGLLVLSNIRDHIPTTQRPVNDPFMDTRGPPPRRDAPNQIPTTPAPPGINTVADGFSMLTTVPSVPLTVAPAGENLKPKNAVVRKAFPESWLWCNGTSVNGKFIYSTTVPDTITSWIASAFAVSSHAGLGISSQSAKMQVFKPFFVSLNLPYSVVRGEQLVLQAIVFNYMSSDTNVTVTLPASDEYRSLVVSASGSTANVKQTDTVTIRAKANQGTTVSFPIIPTIIGKMRVKVTAVAAGAIDAVQRDLLVEAEGVEKEYNQAVLINLKNSSSFTQTVKIDFPPNVVSDSTRVEFSVVGDTMGPSINGLDKLIKMPYGCGEQNMLNFAPTIFVTDYLAKTNQLTSEMKSKSISYMDKGYQRELTYQRNDGSFSAFGQSDYSGSMWLTAFVAKSFQQARDIIYIDEETIERAVDWMLRRQNPDGSFPEPGRILNKALAGGVGSSNPVTLTAYVLTALSEVRLAFPQIALRIASAKMKSQRYLELHSSTLTDPYSLALTSYALFKSESSNVDLTLGPLELLAITKDGERYWEQPQARPATNSRVWRPPHVQGRAVNIELAAYVLQLKAERMAKLPATSPAVFKTYQSALAIVKWLSGQRNHNGGFVSTQDTVVALQALSKFAKASNPATDMKVSTTALGKTYDYSITQDNHLVLQSRVLEPSVKSVIIGATGTGLALAQISATYNVEAYEQEPAFDTVATVLSEGDNSITIRVCTRWLLADKTGMAVKEIGIPSGFSADIEKLELKRYNGVKRIEGGDRKVILYLDEIGSEEICVDVEATRTGLVAKARPVAVKVYDYYEPENQQTIFYASKRLANINICDVCGASCGGCAAYFKRK